MVALKDEDPIKESNPVGADFVDTIVVKAEDVGDVSAVLGGTAIITTIDDVEVASVAPREHPAEDYIRRYVREAYREKAEVWAVVQNGLRFERVEGEDILPPHSEIYIRIGRSGRND